MAVPNQIVRKFLTDHGSILLSKNYKNKWHVFKSQEGAIIKIPNEDILDIEILYEQAEFQLGIHHHDLDLWLGENGVK